MINNDILIVILPRKAQTEKSYELQIPFITKEIGRQR